MMIDLLNHTCLGFITLNVVACTYNTKSHMMLFFNTQIFGPHSPLQHLVLDVID